MKTIIGIYKITNPNNEVYIGATRDVAKRRRSYGNNKSQGRLILASIIKYGWINHDFKVVHELPNDISQVVMDSYEQTYIDFYKKSGCLSLNLRGAGVRGSHCEDTKTKMSIVKVGSKISDEIKMKISVSKTGTVASDETKMKLRILRIGSRASDETKKKISISKTRGKHNLAKKVINMGTGKVYDCAKDAATEMKINYSTLISYLCGRCPNKTTLKYL